MMLVAKKTDKDCVMNLIVKESQVSFKELEQKIFAYVCELGREITRIMLEAYDKELAEGMDKIGLISTNLAEKIALTATESSYRTTADIISQTCG